MHYMQHGCIAPIYTLRKTPNNRLIINKGIVVDTYEMNVPIMRDLSICATICGATYNPHIYFYFRKGGFHCDNNSKRHVKCVRPYYLHNKVEHFICKDVGDTKDFSSHICFVMSVKEVLFLYDRNDATMLQQELKPVVKTEDYNIYKIQCDKQYYVCSLDYQYRMNYKNQNLQIRCV